MEIEVKVRVPDLDVFREIARSRGWEEIAPRSFERNVLYDYPEGFLSCSGCLLRVREVGGRGLLTFKGKPQADRSFKVRPEYETALEKPREMRVILENIGLRKRFVYEKYRTEYSAGDAILCLDELPFGTFLEIEGDPENIRSVASELKIEEESFIKDSYAALYSQHCEERGQRAGDMVFGEPDER